jgi:hypothetical protein
MGLFELQGCTLIVAPGTGSPEALTAVAGAAALRACNPVSRTS